MARRTLYNTALEERKTAWERCHVSVRYYQQKAELPDLKVDFPEYTEVHSQVLQDVLLRLERAFQTFFRRVKNGEEPGYPRFQGRNRYHSFTYPQYGNGAVFDGGILSLSKIGRIPIRVHRPLAGMPKTVTISQEADGWYVSLSCAEVPTEPLPLTGRATGIDVGLPVFLVTADGEMVDNPRQYRKAERQLAKAQRRASRRKKGSTRRRKAVCQCAKKHQHVRRQRADFHHKTALALLRTYDVIYLEDLQSATWCGIATLPRASAMPAGRSSAPSSRAKQHTLASGLSQFLPSTPARIVAAVGNVCRKVSRCAPMSVPPVDW